MNSRNKVLVVVLAQVALILVMGVLLVYERASLPRAWVPTAGFDPDLPIRGRYAALGLLFPPAPESTEVQDDYACGRIDVRQGRAVAVVVSPRQAEADDAFAGMGRNVVCFSHRRDFPQAPWQLNEPVPFFLPEHVTDPTVGRQPGELWVEVTLPSRGLPRPIRLGLVKNGKIEPIVADARDIG